MTDAVKVAEPQPDQHESIETLVVGLNEFRGRLRRGMMTDCETAYRALEYLKLP